MRRIAAMALTIGAVLALSACQTDNGPPVVTNPPPQMPAEPATPATTAWAGQMVTAALATEKSARDAGKDEAGVADAINQTITAQIQAYLSTGVSPMQIMAGASLAQADPRNTPATTKAFKAFNYQMIITVQPAGHCTGCRD